MHSHLTGYWELVHDGRSLPNGVAGGQAASVAGFLLVFFRVGYWADWIATAVHGSLSAISHATQRGPSAFNCGMLGVETIAGLLRRCEEGIVASIFIMSEPIRVAVTGAAGQIGYSLLLRIAAGAVSHFHDL